MGLTVTQSTAQDTSATQLPRSTEIIRIIVEVVGGVGGNFMCYSSIDGALLVCFECEFLKTVFVARDGGGARERCSL